MKRQHLFTSQQPVRISTKYDCNNYTVSYAGVSIKGTYTNIRIGNTTIITCMIVPLPLNTTYEWMSQNGSAINSSNVLMLTGSQVINGSNYTCLVNSSQLFSLIRKNITFTVQGKIRLSCCSFKSIIINFTDTRILQVSVVPMTITALSGTTDVTLTCSIQLSNDIGPDHSALNVSWWSPASTIPGLLTTMSMTQQKLFNSSLKISPITQGQLYCCNASLARNSTVVSSCTNVKTSGIQLE